VPNVIIKYNRPERYQPMSEYVYGNGDRVVSRNEFNPDYWHPRWESATYYHQDVLGSTSLMTNEHGHTVERYTYDAFGVQTDGSFERVNEIGYTGQRYDPTTNMYNYGFRDYTPSIARFTTVDPIRDGNNWYAYVNNDPVNFVDPDGLVPIESADYHDRPFGGSNEGAQRHFFDTNTGSLRIGTVQPMELGLSAPRAGRQRRGNPPATTNFSEIFTSALDNPRVRGAGQVLAGAATGGTTLFIAANAGAASALVASRISAGITTSGILIASGSYSLVTGNEPVVTVAETLTSTFAAVGAAAERAFGQALSPLLGADTSTNDKCNTRESR
tara:strand:+ start:132 stop:1118 length:987 start_codon:yes stop_codon:yes gene_type:complete